MSLSFQYFKLKTDLEFDQAKLDAEDKLKNRFYGGGLTFRAIPYNYTPKNSILKAIQDTALANGAPALPHERVFYNTDNAIKSLLITTDTKRTQFEV